MDIRQIKILIKEFNDCELTKLKIKEKDFKITLEKGITSSTSSTPISVSAPVATQESEIILTSETNYDEKEDDKILSPMVGTFYTSPSPNAPIFAKVGDTITKGSPIAIVEAMKIMNEIEAEFNCKIIKILVENGQAVEYGMPLFLVDKI